MYTVVVVGIVVIVVIVVVLYEELPWHTSFFNKAQFVIYSRDNKKAVGLMAQLSAA